MQHPDPKREKLTLLVAQLLISGLMALLMTFLFSILLPGLAQGALAPGWGWAWLRNWLSAWPVAFVLSLGVGPLAFRLAFLVLHRPG